MSRVFTAEEVARHNKESDCWIIIGNATNGGPRVYDITKFIDTHPGGPEFLLDYAGKNGDDMFEDIGHSKTAREVMARYLIGSLKRLMPTTDRSIKSTRSSSRVREAKNDLAAPAPEPVSVIRPTPFDAATAAHRQREHVNLFLKRLGARPLLPNTDTSPKSYVWVKYSVWKLLLYHLSVLLSCGLLFIVSVHKPRLKKQLTTSTCDAEEATMAFDGDNCAEITKVTLPESDGGGMIVFEVNGTNYYASAKDNYAAVLKVPEEPPNFADAYVRGVGDRLSREAILALYGTNRMTMKVPDPLSIIMLQALSPVYVLHHLAAAIWVYNSCYIYAAVVMLISVRSIYSAISGKLHSIHRLHYLCDSAVPTGKVNLTNREGQVVIASDVPAADLLPGDYFFLREYMTIPCDVILICGSISGRHLHIKSSTKPWPLLPLPAECVEPFNSGERIMLTDRAYSSRSFDHNLQGGSSIRSCDDDAVAVAHKTGLRSMAGSIVVGLANSEIMDKLECAPSQSNYLHAFFPLAAVNALLYGWSRYQLQTPQTDTSQCILAGGQCSVDDQSSCFNGQYAMIAYVVILTILVPIFLLAVVYVVLMSHGRLSSLLLRKSYR